MELKQVNFLFNLCFLISFFSAHSNNAAQITNHLHTRWQTEEDERLMGAVIESTKKFGFLKWQFIAAQVLTRDGRQCKERWQNNHNPDYSKQPLSDDEKKYILQRQQEIGNKWLQISREIKKPPNHIKNFFHGWRRKNRENNEAHRSLIGSEIPSIKFLALCEIAEQYYEEEMNCSD